MINEQDTIDLIKSLFEKGQDQYKARLKGVHYERTAYLTLGKTIDDYLTSPKPLVQFFIMPGLKGSGKTTLLFQAYRYLLEIRKISPERVLFLDVNRLVEGYNLSLFEIFQVLEKHFIKEGFENLKEPLFFLIDEAHYDPKWDQATKVLSERTRNIFFIITGSSALRLASSDVERRSNVHFIFPLNFQEYAKIKYGILPPKNSNASQYIRKALFELETSKSYEVLKMVWENLNKGFIPKFDKGLDWELKNFLAVGGLPFTLLGFESKSRSADALVRSLDKVILDDLYPQIPTIQSNDARRCFAVLHSLIKSLGNPNSTENIFESVKPLINLRSRDTKKLISSTSMVYTILDNLIKTQIIFPVKPLSSESKIANHAWKYYFYISTIISSLLIDMGKFNEDDPNLWGDLFENEAAAILEKNRRLKYIGGLGFDYQEKGADFVVLNNNSEKRIFEISFSKDKKEDQVIQTMLRFKSPFGIIIGNHNEVFMKNNILHIPFLLLLMI